MQKYIVFLCSKCHQYTYAKVDQKGKKCPRCRRFHKVTDVKGTVVEGCTKAMRLVKKKQNEKFHSKTKDFKSTTPEITFKQKQQIFRVQSNSYKPIITKKNAQNEEEINQFINRILYFQRNEHIHKNDGFPHYIFDMISTELGMSKNVEKRLVKTLRDRGILISLPSGNFYLTSKDKR
ncbi:MAG: hypothetical protein GF364_17665 [Candidatus Lokiarchaeota archaeon]|nr:hypothetical protein [Candidatus Lokiarchaeota archaeon]